MKIRYAKKILFSKLYTEKWKKLRPPYFDEEKKVWVHPSWHDIPLVIKARTRYHKWLKKSK